MVSCLLIVISLAGARGGNTHTRKRINLSAFSNLCKQLSTSSFGFLAKGFFVLFFFFFPSWLLQMASTFLPLLGTLPGIVPFHFIQLLGCSQGVCLCQEFRKAIVLSESNKINFEELWFGFLFLQQCSLFITEQILGIGNFLLEEEIWQAKL